MTTDTLVRDRTAVSEPNLPSVMAEMGRRAREAATTLSLVSAEAKVAALNNGAAAVRARAAEILAAERLFVSELRHDKPTLEAVFFGLTSPGVAQQR